MNININKISNFYPEKSDINSDVFEVILEDEGHIRVCLLTYGATLCRLMIPNRNGQLENVVLSYENYRDYRNNPLYAGATLAPAAGRIKRASLPIQNQLCPLSANDGRHNLHGGFQSASYQNWTIANNCKTDKQASVTFVLHLPHNLDGFPGNRTLSVRYTLTNRHSLEIAYQATTDVSTYINMSNHSYFNLSGDFTRSGLEQTLQIHADTYLENDTEHIPVYIKPCDHTPFDFRKPSVICSRAAACPGDPQLINANGYNNAFLLQNNPTAPKRPSKALTLSDTISGRHLSLYTDQPSIVLYSGGYIGNSHLLAGGTTSTNSCAIALEPQDIPDVCHITPTRYHLTKPDNPYQRRILYSFGLN